MSTISVPLKPELEKGLERLIKQGYGSNKADVLRRALEKLIEDEAIQAVLISEQEAREGKILRGDLRKLLGYTK
ncbi:hypothetical protein IT409_02170 [Candidatus Falkowbacteria bacterium]|nr:hypothetical protein [Candidatus Falkowbacteria bacterium]